jgi:hypothetical protein
MTITRHWPPDNLASDYLPIGVLYWWERRDHLGFA